jgi:predicted dehydrogenase
MQRVAVVGVLALSCFVVVLAPAGSQDGKRQEPAKELRAGIIGCDTSHVVAFTGLLNDPKAGPELADVKVVAAYPGGSDDIPASKDRLPKFVATLRDRYKVKIVDSIEELLKEVDVVLLESVDGRPHLKQVIPVLKAGKPVFIDKPVAGSLADALQIFALAKKYGVPCFSSSSLRFAAGTAGVKKDAKLGKVLGCDVYGPCSLEPHHPDLFWYGVHGVETLFTIMGTGCESVSRVHTKDVDLVTGKWQDGRVGTFRGIRKGASGYGATVFGEKAVVAIDAYRGPKVIAADVTKVPDKKKSSGSSYGPLVKEIVTFFKTGQAPVSAEETIEIFAFMEAADESKRQGGRPVRLEDVIARARQKAGASEK